MLPSRLRFSLVASAFLSAAAFVSVPAAQAQTIFSDDFNSETPSEAKSNFNNWNVLRGTVDLIGTGPNGTVDDYVEGGQGLGYYVDLDGTTGQAGLFQTKTAFVLTPGTYSLSFTLGKNGSQAESMVVSVGSFFNKTIADSLAYPTVTTITNTFTVNTAATAPITFDHAGGDNAGYVIDNVLLNRISSSAASPEPGSLTLLGLGVVPGMVLGLRRQRRNRISV